VNWTGPIKLHAPSPPRLLVAWLVNLAALFVAGVLVTNVGANDPFAYAAWAAMFGLACASVRHAPRLGRVPLAWVSSAALLFLVCVVMVWLMTLTAPPHHVPNVSGIARAAAIMGLANLSLRLLFRRRPPGRPASRRRMRTSSGT
jgi:uncharacterized membrane protein YvlD (DUF360 family)